MKVGMRKPSLKKSISARTTGRAKRSVKKAVNPMYGKKGMGYINNPSKAVYNKIYHQSTVSTKDVLDAGTKDHVILGANNASTKNDNLDLAEEHKASGSIWDIFKLFYYIIVLLWNLIKVLFFGAIIIGIIYLVISIIF